MCVDSFWLELCHAKTLSPAHHVGSFESEHIDHAGPSYEMHSIRLVDSRNNQW